MLWWGIQMLGVGDSDAKGVGDLDTRGGGFQMLGLGNSYAGCGRYGS